MTDTAYTENLQIRVHPAMRQAIELIAINEGRKRSEVVRELIRKGLQQHHSDEGQGG